MQIFNLQEVKWIAAKSASDVEVSHAIQVSKIMIIGERLRSSLYDVV